MGNYVFLKKILVYELSVFSKKNYTGILLMINCDLF